MFGDPVKLPPVMANRMWIDARTGGDLAGWHLHAEFTTVMKLTENKRLDVTNPDAVVFDHFLDNLRDGENKEED